MRNDSKKRNRMSGISTRSLRLGRETVITLTTKDFVQVGGGCDTTSVTTEIQASGDGTCSRNGTCALLILLVAIGIGMPASLSACSVDASVAISAMSDEATSVGPVSDLRLTPLVWSKGRWSCVGHYNTVPPFTTERDVTASFQVTAAVTGRSQGATVDTNQWLQGFYQEASTTGGGVLLGIHDYITVDPAVVTAPDGSGSGLRVFIDGNTGRFQSTAFTFTPQSDGALLVNFNGQYDVLHGQVPFAESLVASADRTQFSTISSVVLAGNPVVFHRQTCTKI